MDIKTRVNLALFAVLATERPPMDQHTLRLLIRTKLADGRLPVNSMPRVWGGPGNSETCDGCEDIVTKDEFVMEGISLADGRKPLQLHVACFNIWDDERRVLPVRE